MRNSATWLVAVPLDGTQIKEHFRHRRKFFLMALQDAAQAYKGPGTGCGNKAPSPQFCAPTAPDPHASGVSPSGPTRRRWTPQAACSALLAPPLPAYGHAPSTCFKFTAQLEDEMRCLKCSSCEHLKGHCDCTTRSSLGALQSHGAAPEHNPCTPARAAFPPRFLHLPGGKCSTSHIAILLYLVYSGP